MLYRLRTDFELSIITLFGACAVFGILPFAGYRFATGDLITGLVDLTLALSIAGAAAYAWHDRFGHDAGDQVLIACAELIQKSTRQVDRVFRFGGEEFVGLVRETGVDGLRTFSEHLRSRVAAQLRGPDGAITISLGAAALLDNEHWQSWLGRADAAMYRAKAGGRNRIAIDGVEDSRVGSDLGQEATGPEPEA